MWRFSIPVWFYPAVVSAAALMGNPELSEGQDRWKGAHAQLVLNKGGDGGLGYAVGTEVALNDRIRASFQRISWLGVRGCAVDDAPTECNNEPVLWQVGGQVTLASGENVTPFLGGGFGLYRRTWHTTPGPSIRYLENSKRKNHPSLSLTAGMDFPVFRALWTRISVVHQEVFSSDLEWFYGERVRFTGLLLGFGIVS